MNPIFSMLQNPSKSIEMEMSAVRLSPEEVFLEAMDQVDYALEDPGQYRLYGVVRPIVLRYS